MGSDRNTEFFSDFICTVCRESDKKMLYTKCGHSFCDTCKANLFAFRQSHTIYCPICREPLKRTDVCEKSNQEIDFDAEISIRNKLCLQFNETRDNFETTKEYNDYLEFYEQIVNLKIRNSKDTFPSTQDRQKSIEKEEKEISEYQKQKNEREARRDAAMKLKTIQSNREKVSWDDIVWPQKKLDVKEQVHGSNTEANRHMRETIKTSGYDQNFLETKGLRMLEMYCHKFT